MDVTFEVRYQGGTIIVERRGAAEQWQLLLVGTESIASVHGGAAEPSARGALVTPARDAERLEIVLDGRY